MQKTCVTCSKPATRNISINNGDDVIITPLCDEHYASMITEIYRRVDEQIDQTSDIHHSKEE